MSHTMQNEWVVDSRCTHHMVKDATLFTRLNKFESIIYVVDDFSLVVVGQGDIACRRGKIVNVYHVANLSANLLSISQLNHTHKNVEFLPDRFFIQDLKKREFDCP
jgi:hypothetical protein